MIVGYSFHAGDIGMHAGHIWQLKHSKRLCDFLIAGILTDRAIENYKRAPIVSYAFRIIPYEVCRYVDKVVPQDSRDPTDNLKNCRPDILFHGDDWPEIPGSEWMEANGKQVIVTPYFHGISTSSIVERIITERCQKEK